MSSQSADRNLLFGVFALQMDFLTRDQLVEGMQAWILEKSRLLEDILVERGFLASADRDLLLPLVARHVEQHGGDPEKSLKAVSSVTASVEVLKQIEDSDLQHSLGSLRLREPAPEGDGPTTISFKPDFGQPGLRYMCIRPHAKGGLGEVFVARDTELDREVALKEIQSRHAHNADSRSRFLMEAEITGKLEHPGIVPVYGLGHYPDGRPFYAMRFIRGDSLRHAIQEFHKNLPIGNSYESVAFRKLLGRFVDVCNAVGYAHSRGVLHRDLKPGNVMLGKHGETLVVDWGLAKVKGREESAPRGEATLQISSGSGTDQTLPGSAIGTPGYMSPEQADGKLALLGPATDIYGLGATFYTLLTGKKPLEAQTVHEALDRTVKGLIPRPREQNPQVPKLLEAICLKAMAQRPADRYPTCQALVDDVERFLADEPITAHRDSLSDRISRFFRRHRAVLQAISVALLLIATTATLAALLINAERVENAELAKREEQARKNAEYLAAEKARLAMEKSALADETTILARKESLARQDAERIAKQLERELSRNYLIQGLAKYDSNQREAGLVDLGMAWAKCSTDDSMRQHYRQILADRMIAGGRLIGFCLHHKDPVSVVAFSPDGQRLITGSWNPQGNQSELRLWDGWTGSPKGEPLSLEGSIDAVMFSPDGNQIIIGGAKSAQLWDLQKRELIYELHNTGQVLAVAFSPDGRWIITAGADKTVRLWNTSTGSLRGKPFHHKNFVRTVAFSPDGGFILTGSDDGFARLWNIEAEVPILRGELHHKERINAVAFSPDGQRVVTGSGGLNTKGEARLWDLRTQTPVGKLMEHEHIVNAVAFSPDGQWLITGSGGLLGVIGRARLWDGQTGALLDESIIHESSIRAVSFSPDSQRLITASYKMASVWDVRRSPFLEAILPHKYDVNTVAYSPDGRTVVTGSGGPFGSYGEVRLWDAETNSPMGEPMVHAGAVHVVAFSPDGRYVLTGSADKTARIWDARKSTPLGKPLVHAGAVHAVAFSPDGRYVLTGSTDKTARIWDARTGDLVGKPLLHKASVFAVAFTADGRTAITDSEDSANDIIANAWDVQTGKSLPYDRGLLQPGLYSSHGLRGITALRDRTARLIDTRTSVVLGQPLRHEGHVRAVALSPDGQRAITGAVDKTAKIWDVSLAGFPEEDRHMELCFEIRTQRTLTNKGLSINEWNDRWRTLESEAGSFLGRMRRQSIKRMNSGHRIAAMESERTGHWFAAEFHWRHLLRLQPENQELKSRHERAVMELEHLKAAANSPRNAVPPLEPAIAQKPE